MSFVMDWERETRTGTPEAVFCEGKRSKDIDAILAAARARGQRLLLTRLATDHYAALSPESRADLDFHPLSRTAISGDTPAPRDPSVAVVAAGTSDLPAAHEAARSLAFFGYNAPIVADVGVAGIWRLEARIHDIESHAVVIAVAGMEGALFSVLGGLIAQPIIAVPTSNGYGVAQGGKAALSSALATCAPGVTTVNIDNGFGAACAACRVLRLIQGKPTQPRG
ncbi:MAG: nickel pincer cofactor biosynthesis protein LarB [Pseudomonadota bacterium]